MENQTPTPQPLASFGNEPELYKGLEELRRDNVNVLRNVEQQVVDTSNTKLADLSKYLFTVSTILIPISASLVGIKEIRDSLTLLDKSLLGQSLVLLLLSIICGLCYLITDIRFFSRVRKTLKSQLLLWASTSYWPNIPGISNLVKSFKDYEEISKRVADIGAGEEEESSSFFIILQGTFAVVGIVPLIIIAFRLLSL